MLNYILSALDDAVLAYNIDEEQYMFISPAVKDVMGYTAEQFTSIPHLLRDIIHPDDRALVLEELNSIPVPGEKQATFRIILPNKEVRWIQAKRVQLVHNDTKQKIGITILKNVTEAVLYRAGAEKKVWFLSSLINSVSALIFRIDINGNYTYVNNIYCSRLGYKSEELLGQPVEKVAHPDDVTGLKRLVTQSLASPGKVFHFRHRKITADGNIRWIVTDAIAVKDEHNNVAEIQGVGLDVTDQEKAREEILWTKNNLEALINNTNDFIWSIDKNMNYVFANIAFRKWINEVYHVEPKEGMPANDQSVYPNTVARKWDGYYKRALGGHTFKIMYDEVNPGLNQTVNFEISFNTIYDGNGEIIGVGCFAHDISVRLKTQQSIIAQNEKLRHIASLSSHELRRPVATLMGLVDVLDKENIANPENNSIINHIDTVAHELDSVIRQIVNKAFIDDLL